MGYKFEKNSTRNFLQVNDYVPQAYFLHKKFTQTINGNELYCLSQKLLKTVM